MKIVLQRVSSASVTVDGKIIGSINNGYVVFLGISHTDSEKNADRLVDKIQKLRIFADQNDKINLSSIDIKGEILIISQFTLYADCKKGNRPSFINAGSPIHAEKLYNYFVEISKNKFCRVQSGIFGADMKVSLINDGPFTLILEDE